MDQAVEKKLWANKGEAIVCLNGHHICDIAHDIYVGDGRSPEDFANWTQPQPERNAHVGSIVCKICKRRWVNGSKANGYTFHFANGWR